MPSPNMLGTSALKATQSVGYRRVAPVADEDVRRARSFGDDVAWFIAVQPVQSHKVLFRYIE